MMTKKRIFLLLSVPLFLLLTALECEEQCKKCEDAIQHMADNIGGQLCRVNNMTNAWDRIREECDHFDSAVGLMAETCYMGLRNSAFDEMFTVPDCKVLIANLKQSGIEINIYTTNFTFDFDIIFQFPRDSFHFGSDQVNTGSANGNYSLPLLFDVDVVEGDFVEIIVINTETNIEIGRESVRFTFDRKDNWARGRFVVVHTPDFQIPGHGETAHITFDGWES